NIQANKAWVSKAMSHVPASDEGTAPGCPLKLKSAGTCGDGDECPYQVTLPPLTIQLPKQFRLLEKTMRELQSLRETVNQLKRSCMACTSTRQRLDRYLQEGKGETLVQDQPEGAERRGDAPPAGSGMQEMQVKMSRMSNSLKNARGQITLLQGRVEELSVLNMGTVESIVDRKVENITGVINKLSSSCTSLCPQATAPQAANITFAARDCSDYSLLGQRKNGVYKVVPDPQNGIFEVYCEMESYGGGWTVVQQRLNGSVSFNRTWAEYKNGFGDLRGEFWLGNDHIHLLTKTRDVVLRIELEDFQGVREYAKYDEFYVANEFLRYKLSISGYSGTAGNALSYDKHFNHDQKFFSTPDKDNDMYPSGNCGAYYSSGWWFDACMSANLNGKYYHKRYKGVRNGIFWGTWHNMSSEYYPTSYRQAFKTVRMMIRPKNYAP
uniref:Fibrinogen C-terminal domain-containing protein n=1 Tax=Denticeps clupeoides TaxID=299321 RepID=A0AAY4EJR1_9TELE